MPALARSRRLARLAAAWVLLWFAALQATALLQLPVVATAAGHHQHSQQDCDEEHPGHGQGGHTAAHHLAQCPACLFSAAPPPRDFALPGHGVTPPAPPVPPRAAAPRGQALAQPPARGPPRFS
ncbi:hypothetical protein [Ramlibacter sp. AN1133]|uniref:hypothetical protein n=1 Tax=Ramlibacter sp. AN1133 TaxID=3133429 RepID=UPI0030C0C502